MILNKQVGVFLNLVHNRFKQYITTIFLEQGYDLSPEQFLVMDTLWDEGVISQQKIADTILKDKNSVVKLIDGLEKKKLVRRVADTRDRRQNLIEITPYALKIKEEVTSLAMKAVNLIIKDIPREDMYKFIRVLSKMAENMNTDITLLKLAQAKNSELAQISGKEKEK
jgi:MarR family transcriptional regulator, organic hydroperoxide resistance regulator